MKNRLIEIPIPETIKIGGLDYRVRFDAESQKELKYDSRWGCVVHSKQEISFDIDASPQRLSEAFIHEMLHLAERNSEEDLDEKIIGRLGRGLHQIMEQLGIRFVRC